MKNRWMLLFVGAALVSSVFGGPTAEWPQFRGPGGAAVSEVALPPIQFGPATNLLWKVVAPPGYSSPIIAGERIYLTAENGEQLETHAINLRDGRTLWRRSAGAGKPATSTPVTDGSSVFAFFGTVGVIAYDLEGKELWRKPLPKPDPEISSSPILIGDKLFIVCDVGAGSFVEALDKATGRSLWKTGRERVRRSVSTPFHWVSEKRDELIVAGSYWLTSYDPNTGKQNWQYSGVSTSASSTPVANRGILFAATLSDLSAPADDAQPGAAALDFNQLLAAPLPKPENAVVAIRSCGKGEVNETHLAWKMTRSLPGASSPLIYAGRLFTIKTGGFVSAYQLENGRAVYQDERLNAPGDYYASAVAADGRVYFISQSGIATVIDAKADSPTILSQNKFTEQILATPALAGKTLVIRGEKNLYAFGE